jgi:hypothetical protein
MPRFGVAALLSNIRTGGATLGATARPWCRKVISTLNSKVEIMNTAKTEAGAAPSGATAEPTTNKINRPKK